MLTHGAGVYLYDETGKRYLDAAGGVGVVNVGHGVREIVEVISYQAGKLTFSYGSSVANELRQLLADMLEEGAPAGMRETRIRYCWLTPTRVLPEGRAGRGGG